MHDLKYQEIILDEMPVQHTSFTKQPTKTTKIRDWAVKKAIKCMDQATADGEGTMDSVELFGRYVASELRVLNPQSKTWAKLQIQNSLFDAAQYEMSAPFPHSAMDPLYSSYPACHQSHSSIHTYT